MRTTIRPISIVLISLLLSACSSTPYKVDFDFDPEAPYSQYQTWSWIDEHPMIVTDSVAGMSPLWEGRIMTHIHEEMTAKGFQEVENPDRADMTISFSIGARDKIRVDSYPVSYRASYGRGWRFGYYGVGHATETRVRQYTEGMLAIDIFDRRTRSPVWHGYAKGNVRQSRDRAEREALVHQVVRELMRAFPPA